MQNRNYNTIPKREITNKRTGLRLLLAGVALAGAAKFGIDTFDRLKDPAPITAYQPNSPDAQKDRAVYDAKFSEYASTPEHSLIGDIAQVYAKSHGLDNKQPVVDELERQAIEFNKEQYHQNNNTTIYPGESFMLPNDPHQPN